MKQAILIAAIVTFLLLVSKSSASSHNERVQRLQEDTSGSGCFLCQFLITQVKEVAEQYKGEVTEEFKNLVCGKLPEAAQGLCKVFVQEYGPQVIDALLNKLDAEKICKSLGLCDQVWMRKFVTDKQAFLIYLEMQQMSNDEDFCAMCKFVVGEIEAYVNKSEEEIEHQLVKACKLLPGQLEQLCDTVVLLYGHQIIQYLLEYETPPIVCKQVGLCKDAAQPKPAAQPIKVTEEPSNDDNDTKCELCKYVIGLAEDFIKGNKTEEKIREALHKVCEKFGPISEQCNKFVDEYEPLIIEYILQKLTPQEVCEKIHLCEKTSQLASNDNCDLCQFVISTIEDYVKRNETVHVIEEKLKQICGFLPDTYKSSCVAIAETYVPQIVEYITQKYDAKTICTMLGFCESQQVPKTGKAFIPSF